MMIVPAPVFFAGFAVRCRTMCGPRSGGVKPQMFGMFMVEFIPVWQVHAGMPMAVVVVVPVVDASPRIEVHVPIGVVVVIVNHTRRRSRRVNDAPNRTASGKEQRGSEHEAGTAFLEHLCY